MLFFAKNRLTHQPFRNSFLLNTQYVRYHMLHVVLEQLPLGQLTSEKNLLLLKPTYYQDGLSL